MNNVNIIGRITNDLELKNVGQDSILLNFSIAYNERWGSREETYFFDVVSWGKQAEIVANYFKKGQRIGVSGRLKQERFQDKEGNNRSRVTILLRDFTFIEGKNSTNATTGTTGSASGFENNTNSSAANNFNNFSPPNLDEEVPF